MENNSSADHSVNSRSEIAFHEVDS